MFEPLTNEVWVKHTDDPDADFSLVSPMRYGVNYKVKHSGNFLYKLTNEDDGVNYKLVKIPLPTKYALLNEPTQATEISQENDQLQEIKYEVMPMPGDRSINLPAGKYFEDRSLAIETKSDNALVLLEPSELAKTYYDAKILDFEVYEHYLCMIEERNQVEQIKVMNLKNNTWKTYIQPEEFYHIKLEDNLTYNTQYLRYRMSTPHWPDQVHELNMGIGKNDVIYNDIHK